MLFLLFTVPADVHDQGRVVALAEEARPHGRYHLHHLVGLHRFRVHHGGVGLTRLRALACADCGRPSARNNKREAEMQRLRLRLRKNSYVDVSLSQTAQQKNGWLSGESVPAGDIPRKVSDRSTINLKQDSQGN